jgi:hypothetical protein
MEGGSLRIVVVIDSIGQLPVVGLACYKTLNIYSTQQLEVLRSWRPRERIRMEVLTYGFSVAEPGGIVS